MMISITIKVENQTNELRLSVDNQSIIEETFVERISQHLIKLSESETLWLYDQWGYFVPPITDKNSQKSLDPYGSFANNDVNDGAILILDTSPRGGGGGLDALAIAASIATILQLVMMVIDKVEQRKQDHQNKPKKSQVITLSNDVEIIRVLMDNGKWVKFDNWISDPSKVRTFIRTFDGYSESPKPEKIVFILKNRQRAEIKVSNTVASQKELDEVIKYLNSGQSIHGG